MITAIKAENIGAYKALFEEASDILSGYKRVRTYDKEIKEYYYKNGNAATADDLFILDDTINSLTTFATALEKYSILYVREGEPTAGFEPMLGITTLEEYFSWIQNLSQASRKYTVLPLDEEYFEINANTRAINIPASFKKNGIAVQGDDLAEVVYFKIDRYFDYMDLYNTDIYIQWETPKDATGQVTKSVSPAYIRDITSEPGKLIFGWAISDAITKQSGQLKFSVRFFQWEDENKVTIADDKTVTGEKILAYSFSTLTASLPILASIAFNPEADEYKLDDAGERINGRIENSEIAGGYAAAEPIFIKDLDVPNADLIYDLGTAGNEPGTYVMLVEAASADTGAISYTWRHQALTEDNKSEGTEITIIEPSKIENVMTQVDDISNLNSAYTYYKTDGSNAIGVPIYVTFNPNALTTEQLNTFEEVVITEDDFNAHQSRYFADDKGTKALPPFNPDAKYYERKFKLYTRQSKYIANEAGVYWATAENRITNSSNSKAGKKAMFPRPDYVHITNFTNIIGTILANGVAGLSVAASNTDGVLSYQWYIDENYTLNFGGKEPNYVAIEGATAATYEATKPGHYIARVTNTRNLDSKSDDTDAIRVTNAAKTPVFTNEISTTKIFATSALTDTNCPTVYIDTTAVEADEYTISWYLAEEGKAPSVIVENAKVTEVSKEGVLKHSFNPDSELYRSKIIEISDDHDIDGSYYAIVTNHVNESVASTAKPETYEEMFLITDL